MRFSVSLGAVLLMASAPRSASAEPPAHHGFQSYLSDPELGAQGVQILHQDAAGYVWAGTEDGLFRYNGQRFERFTEADGVPSTVIRSLHSDGFGALWIGTFRGVARWNGQRFEPFGASKGLLEKEAYHLTHDAEGRLWVAFDREPYRFTREERFEPVAGWSYGACTALGRAERVPRVWLGAQLETGSDAIRLLSYENGAFQVWPFSSPGPLDPIQSITEDAQGAVWARSRKSLWVLNPGGTTFTPPAAALPPAEDVGRLRLGDRGQIMVPTSAGLYWLEGDTWQVLQAREGMPTAWAADALVDREGTLWVSGIGVHRRLGRGLWRAYTTQEGLPGEVVWSVFRSSTGTLWVGTNRGLLRAEGASWQLIPGTQAYLVESIQETTDGRIMAAGNPGDVLSWDLRTQVLRKFPAVRGATAFAIYRMVVDAGQKVWLATSNNGLLVADLNDPELRFQAVPLPQGKPDETFIHVSRGAAGRIWASGQLGLALYADGQWRRFTKQHGLLADEVALAVETPAAELLVVCLGVHGYSRFQLVPDGLRAIEHTSQTKGPHEPTMYSIAEDGEQRLWLGTPHGIIVRTASGEETFNLHDGLPGEDVSNMAYWQDHNGDVWFGTVGGLARFDGARYRGPLPAPRTWINRALLGALPVLAGSVPSVPATDNTFVARFASQSFSSAGKLSYQFRIAGVDPDWQLTEAYEARYPKLAHGSYSFQVRSRVAEGSWGPPAEVSFVILPAWYHTWWARLLFALLALGCVAALFRWRVRTLKQRNQQLEETVALRTRELARTNVDLQSANANMRLVLDNVEQGLVLVDRQGRLTSERSKAFETWFGPSPTGEHFAATLVQDDENAALSLELGYEQLIDAVLPLELSLDQLPKELARGTQRYTLSFKPVVRAGAVDTILLMVSDVTAQLEARRADEQQREQIAIFERIMRDRLGFLDFLVEARAQISQIEAGRFESLTERLRLIHTLKGNAGLFGVVSVANAAHRLEQALSDGQDAEATACVHDLTRNWRDFSERTTPLLGTGLEERIDMTPAELQQLLLAAEQRKPHAEIKALLTELRGEPIALRLARIAEQIESLAKRLGKAEPLLVVRAEPLRLSRLAYAGFWSSLAHVVRNMVDHGFQTAEERRAAGKPAANHAELLVERVREQLCVRIADDGHGIAWEAVAERAARAGLPHRTRADLVAALFHPQLSTRDTVSEVSGRGLGMSTVLEACRALGGSVTVQSETGQGARFSFELPLLGADQDVVLSERLTANGLSERS